MAQVSASLVNTAHQQQQIAALPIKSILKHSISSTSSDASSSDAVGNRLLTTATTPIASPIEMLKELRVVEIKEVKEVPFPQQLQQQSQQQLIKQQQQQRSPLVKSPKTYKLNEQIELMLSNCDASKGAIKCHLCTVAVVAEVTAIKYHLRGHTKRDLFNKEQMGSESSRAKELCHLMQLCFPIHRHSPDLTINQQLPVLKGSTPSSNTFTPGAKQAMMHGAAIFGEQLYKSKFTNTAIGKQL